MPRCIGTLNAFRANEHLLVWQISATETTNSISPQFHFYRFKWVLNERRILISYLLVGALLLPGCKEEQALVLSDATLKGKVNYKGKPVPYALIIVMGAKGSATVNAD